MNAEVKRLTEKLGRHPNVQEQYEAIPNAELERIEQAVDTMLGVGALTAPRVRQVLFLLTGKTVGVCELIVRKEVDARLAARVMELQGYDVDQYPALAGVLKGATK